MVNRNIIPTPLLTIYYPDGSVLGENMNELEIYDLLYQIAKLRFNGCYFIDDKGDKSYISELGDMEWPERFNQDMAAIYKLSMLQLEIRQA